MRRIENTAHPCLDEYSRLLCRARQLVRGKEHCAEDLVQEVMLRAIATPTSISAPGSWTRAVLRNLVRRRWARYARRSEHADPEALQGLLAVPDEAPEEESISVGRIRSELDRLPAKFRIAIECTYFLGLSLQETSTRLGVPYRTVLSRRARGLTRLRQALGVDGMTWLE